MGNGAIDGFCARASAVLRGGRAAEIPRRMADLLPDLLSDPALLCAAHRTAPAEGYGRNPLFVCPEDGFSVIAVVWPPGIATPIHDHATWCAFGLYEGTMRETRYAPRGKSCETALAEAMSCTDHRRGAVAHLPVDMPDIHSMHNPTAATAISIHVYGGNVLKRGPNIETVYSLAA